MDRDLKAGRQLAEALEAFGVPLTGAGWMFFEESQEWRYYVVSPAVADVGPRPIFMKVRDVLSRLGPDFPIKFMDIGVANDDGGLPAKVVRAAAGRNPVERVRGVGLVERTVPDAYVFCPRDKGKRTMKRDMDIVRKILMAVRDSETKPRPQAVIEKTGIDPEIVLYHLDLLHEARLLKGNVSRQISGPPDWWDLDLTWEGNDFVDAVSDEDTWQKTKRVAEETRAFTWDLLKELAKGFVRKKIEDQTGIKLA